MYELSAGDLVEVQIVGRLHGQVTRNVFHYYAGPGANFADGKSALEEAVTYFDANMGAKVRTMASEEWSHEYNTIQKIEPVRYRLIVDPVGVAGAVEGESLPSGVAQVVSLFAEIADRRGSGRRFFAGVPLSAEQDSLLNPGAVALLDNVGQECLLGLNAGVGNEDLIPTLVTTLDQGPAGIYRIITRVARNTLRYQRRREVGVGE